MARSPVDMDNMTDGQLREIIQQAREMLGRRIQERLDEFRMLAREAGFEVSITKIGEGGGQRRRRRYAGEAETQDRRGSVAPKFRNPDNAAEEWSGRGRKPKWVEGKLASGTKLEDLQIREAVASEA